MSTSTRHALPFPPAPGARASLKPGALYAIDGGDPFIYYGQVTPEKTLGFFRIRNQVVSASAALSADPMCRFAVLNPSIGRAIRSGKWLSLGMHPLHPQLHPHATMAQWPVGLSAPAACDCS